MAALAILWIIFCIGIGVAHPELVKTMLFLSWVVMAIMAIGSILYSVFRLLA